MVHKKNKVTLCLLYCFSIMGIFTVSNALIIGSKSSASSQSFSIFPSSDSNNTLLGFASFENGFQLADQLTTATFDNFLPVSGPIGLGNGRLMLLQDFCIANESTFLTGGYVVGNHHAFKMPPQVGTFKLPLGACAYFEDKASFDLGISGNPDLRTVDWAFDNVYLAGGQREESSAGDELKIFYFDGTNLTVTLSISYDNDVESVRWHPTQPYLGVGQASRSGDDFKIYFHNVSNGTLVETDGVNVGGTASAIAWHPSGDYIVIGSDENNNELLVYSFSAGILGAELPVNISPNENVNRDALSFSPGGDKLAVGLTENSGSGVGELLIYDFSYPTSLTLTTSVDTGENVQSVDWSPTGSYVAVGLTGGSENIRVYDVSSGTALEVLAARQTQSRNTFAVQWHPSGDYLAVGLDNGLNYELFLYFFDKVSGRLIQVNGIESTDEVWALRWSRDGECIAYTFERVDDISTSRPRFTNSINIAAFNPEGCLLTFENTTIVCNSNVDVKSNINFKGTCRWNGQGKSVKLTNNNQFIVRPNSHLILENCELNNVKMNNVRCLTNSGRITLRNCELCLDQDFTFSQGSLLFEGDVILSGTHIFSYTTPLTSTIADDATWYIGYGATLQYNPTRPSKDLIYMETSDARLFLDGCSLHSTTTGLHLTKGILVIDNDVTMSSAATIPSEGLALNQSLDIQIRGGATLDLYGYVTYE